MPQAQLPVLRAAAQPGWHGQATGLGRTCTAGRPGAAVAPYLWLAAVPQAQQATTVRGAQAVAPQATGLWVHEPGALPRYRGAAGGRPLCPGTAPSLRAAAQPGWHGQATGLGRTCTAGRPGAAVAPYLWLAAVPQAQQATTVRGAQAVAPQATGLWVHVPEAQPRYRCAAGGRPRCPGTAA